ncbi:Omp28-related outer membrane protein, partial [Bacteroidota bacterium]
MSYRIKKTLAVFFIVFVISFTTTENTFLQTSNNVLLEYCTGIWCGYCPCADQIIDSILVEFPNTVVLAYHGENDDPWKNYSEGIRSLLGFYAYPSGIIGRRSGVVYRQTWDSLVTVQNINQPTVSIDIVRSYNPSTRVLNATANVTALINLTGDYYVNFVLTENNIVYPQAVSPGCGIVGTDSNYIHNHVVKGMLNGDRGVLLNSSNPWNQNTTESKSINYNIPIGIAAENCNIVVFVYKSAGVFSSECHIQ